ncbi:MAG TPA: ATP-binding protein [Parafilimonas sp.]|nr:ATP-binding protein [Parafilimonas sp.]
MNFCAQKKQGLYFLRLMLVIFIACACSSICAQQNKIDSLKNLIAKSKTDTGKIDLYEKLGDAYRNARKMDSCISSFELALAINEKNNYSLQHQCWDMAALDYILYEMGNYTESLKYTFDHLALSKKINDTAQIGGAYLVFGHDYRELGEYRLSLDNYFKAYHFWEIFHKGRHEPPDNTFTILCISQVYLKMNKIDSSIVYAHQGYKLGKEASNGGYILLSERLLGDINSAKGDEEAALNYYRQYIPDFVKYKERNRDLGFVLNSMAGIFNKRGQYDSAIFYAKKSLSNAQQYQDQQNIYTASKMLSELYQAKDNDVNNHHVKEPPDTADIFANDKKWVYGVIVDKKDVYKNIDSLRSLLKAANDDNIKSQILKDLGEQYMQINEYDSGINCVQKSLELLQKNKDAVTAELDRLKFLNYNTYITGNYLLSIQYSLQIVEICKRINDPNESAFTLTLIGTNYEGLGDYRKAIDYLLLGKKALERYESGHWAIQNLAEVYLKMHMLDSALYYNQKAYYIADTGHNQQYMKDFAIRIFAFIYAERGDDELAFKYFRLFISDFFKYDLNNREIGHAYLGLAKLLLKNNQVDSSMFYAKRALTAATKFDDAEYVYNASNFLYALHDSLNNESEAFKYFKIAQAAKDSMASIEKIRQIQNLAYQEQVREKEQEEANAKERARNTLFIIIGATMVAIVSFLVWNRIRQLRLKHKMILEQKEAEKLKAIDRMKEKFFTNITHELRTPLSLILSPAEFYLQHPEELKDQHKFLESVYKNSNYLLNLINQLLDISKLDAGKMNVSLSKGNFGNYIAGIVRTFDEEAEKKNINLHFENDLNGDYLFDVEHWKKIVNNLLANALKFTPAKGNIFVSLHPLSSTTDATTVEFSVKDTGIGISKEQLPFITDRFYQADNNLTRKYEGAGIGLSLVNELVKLMNGKLEVQSEEGKGSAFTITTQLTSAKGKDNFPDVPVLSESIQVTNINTTKKVAATVENKNVPVVLVTEDNPELQGFLQNSIQSLYKVITTSNGAEGFEMALSEMPDVIISDVMMPVMDGFEFCDKIKNNPATSHIPFIILTAKTTYESKIAGLQKGADDYLTKPFSVDELRTKIRNILDRQDKLRKHYIEQLTSAKPLPSASGMQDEFLKKTYKIIQEHLDDSQLSVEFLAGKMALNGHALNRKFSSLLGLTTNELIRQFKMKKAEMEHEMLELDAKALRSQMNPHFIFNCLNSIKALIQKNEDEKAITYLTTFSKLIRTIFQNADKREITLFDEIETCRLYTELESMRFGKKINYHFHVDSTADLKSVMVPALTIQPFIENAIWHGIMPKESNGNLKVNVEKNDGLVTCIIDDDGIGREVSMQNKFKGKTSSHESKGVHLTQIRLNIDNALNERNATVEIIDKKDEAGKPKGTTVVLVFTED